MVQLASLFIIANVAAYSVVAAPEKNANKRLRCIDDARHKSAPSEEPSLHGVCDAYSGLSCCKNETAFRALETDMYKWSSLTCNKPMSSSCKKFFSQDACFYECSPHMAQWTVDENGEETVRNIPLCKSECEKWFTACANDFTCTSDWKTAHTKPDFVCKSKDKCQTFRDKFQSAERFCKTIWGNSYTVVSDDEDCVKIDVTAEHVENKTAVYVGDKNSSQRNSAVLIVILVAIVSNLV